MSKSKTDRFLALVQAGGVTVETAKKKLKTSEQGVYGMAYAIRRRGITLLLGSNGEYVAKAEQPAPKTEGLPKSIVEGLLVVPPEFKEETLSVLHRAMFYQSVFKAQVETSLLMRRLRNHA